MNHREIEERIKQAVEHSVPDVSEAILSRCGEEGKVIEMKDRREKKKSGWKKYAAVAAIALLMIGGGGMYLQNSAVDSVIELDVNPSIELSVNKKERVVEAKALNDDAKVILDDMDLKGTDLDVAVNALIGSMMKHGYLSQMQNSILISVENSDTAKGKALEERLVKEVNELLAAGAIDGAILSQQVNGDAKLAKRAEETAEKYGISQGKAALIEKIVSQDSLLKREDLKDLKINELNLLLESKKLDVKDTASKGKASEQSYIGAAKAKSIALKDAAVKEADVTELDVELDVEHGVMTYEVEFKARGLEYDYEIDAVSGKILRNKTEKDDDWYEDHAAQTSSSTGSGSGQQSGSGSGASSVKISESEAKSIALKHAGVKSANASFTKVKLDKDDGIWEYEVEFYAGNAEYEYEINAVSGKILKAEKDVDDDWDDHDDDHDDWDDYDDDDDDDAVRTQGGSGQSSGGGSGAASAKIGEAKAKSIAMKHAGVNASDATAVKVELDEDDGIWKYEVEFKSGSMEYEYEIDANSGTVLKAESDRDD